MNNAIRETLVSRVSANRFVPGQTLDEHTIQELVVQATRAPTAWNLQNWRFVAVQSQDAKTRLRDAAFGQQKIVDAAVAFVICGMLDDAPKLAARLQPSVDAGLLPADVAAAWAEHARAGHMHNSSARRDEAIRSASLAGMALMLAAHGLGLDSCPMSGFDAHQVREALGLADDALPVLIVAVGRATADQGPQKHRRPVAEVLQIL